MIFGLSLLARVFEFYNETVAGFNLIAPAVFFRMNPPTESVVEPCLVFLFARASTIHWAGWFST